MNLDAFTITAGFYARGRQVRFEDLPKEKFDAGTEIARIMGRSDRRGETASMLEQRFGLDSVLEIDFTSGREKLVISGLEEYGIYVHDKVILRFNRHFHEGAIGGYVVTGLPDSHPLNMGGVMGMTSRLDMLLVSEGEETIQHEFQHLFDLMVRAGGGMVDYEFRAIAASIAFTSRGHEIFWRISEEGYAGRTGDEKHEEAHLLFLKKMGRKSLKPGQDGQRFKAHLVLKSVYGKIFGLSYDEILEPFRK